VQIQNSYSPNAVRDLFDEMAATYGVVNLISSFGFCAVWRHHVTRDLPLNPATRIVDLMSGTNELCRSLAAHAPSDLRLTAVDFSPEMVRRARNDWPFHVSSHLEDVFSWKFEPESADIVISSFGLKTLDRHQQMQLSKVVDDLLRPGGVFSFVEISVPPYRMLRFFYMFYLNRIIPWVGHLFLGNPANYRMLGLYTEQFGDCRYFAECLRQHGIQVAEVSYFFGCATGVRGVKPIGPRRTKA
jgi:demethylmenaquinone methyltransferase/2-methoxy-6-polyprenyl-1,4-benzoquinol methylase